MKNRVWSGILCAALLLVGCGGERAETKENDVVRDTQNEADAMETDTELLSVLPAVDWEGYEFRILTTDVRVNETMYHEVYSEGVNGEVVNDAVYARNMSVEDKYKIKITGVFSGLRDFSLFEKAAQAGDDAFDVVLPDQQNAMRYAGRGYLTELSTVPYLDFDRAYWLKNSVTELSIGGRSYFFVGDMNLSAYESVPVYFFNKSMAENYGIDDLYTTMRDGGWTFDRMLAYASLCSADLNGDGAFGKEDAYGIALNGFSVLTLTYSGGFRLVEKDENDFPKISIDQRWIDYLQHAITECSQNPAVLNGDNIAGGNVLEGVNIRKTAFREDRVLFYQEMVTMATELRDMETDFGVLPVPKASDTQDAYLSFFHPQGSAVAIPAANSALERTGMVLEDMGYYSRLGVRPAYIETAVKGKGLRDPESEEVLDTVFDHVTFDVVLQPGILDDLRRNFNTGDAGLISAIEKKLPKYEKTLADTIAAFTAPAK